MNHDHPLARHEWLASRLLQAMADPLAVCKLALINKNFCAASRSDLVWQNAAAACRPLRCPLHRHAPEAAPSLPEPSQKGPLPLTLQAHHIRWRIEGKLPCNPNCQTLVHLPAQFLQPSLLYLAVYSCEQGVHVNRYIIQAR